MYRGTTPQIKLKLDTTINLDTIEALWITFKGIAFEVTKTLDDDIYIFDSAKEIRLGLSQEETLKLKQGAIHVQVRFRTTNGLAYATTIADLSLGNVLKEGVI